MSRELLQVQLAGRIKLRNEFVKHFAASDPIGLEAFKLALGRGEIELGLLGSQTTMASDFDFAPPRFGSRFLATLIMNKINGDRAGYLTRAVCHLFWRIQFLLLVVPVYLVWFFDVIRHSSSASKGLQMAQNWYGFYPENSTRTRALASHIVKSSKSRNLKVVVLGRPRKSLEQSRQVIGDLLPGFKIDAVFPFSPSSACAIALRLFVAHQKFFSWSLKTGYLPTPQETFAGFYRVLQGYAAEKWVRNVQVDPDARLVMCHTGLADTSMLEKALQARGCTTEHWVHGVSDGVNFTGLSTRAFFKSNHDASWHLRLGGYSECVSVSAQENCVFHFPQRKPAGFLLLSNYAHPMNLSYQINGIEDEVSALELFALASSKLQETHPGLMAWRPHPVINSLPAHFRNSLMRKAKDLGIEVLSSSGDFRDLLCQYQYVACTQSTVALDVLNAGGLPVLLSLQPMDPEHCLSALPLRVSNAKDLAATWFEHATTEPKAKAAYLASVKALYTLKNNPLV